MGLPCKTDEILHKASILQADQVFVPIEDGSKSTDGEQVRALHLAIYDSNAKLDE